MRLLSVLATLALLVLAPRAALAADAGLLTGRFVGTYVCAQGKMGLTLDLVGAPDGKITGTFSFAPTKGSGPLAARGTFTLKGELHDSGLFFIDGDQWIDQPEGYQMVGLMGLAGFAGMRVDGFGGQIKAEGCTTYKVERVKP